MRHLSGRPLTVAGGLLLGVLLAAVLLALNVMGVHVDDEDRPPRAGRPEAIDAPLTGNQPELSRALLSGADLGSGFTPAPTATTPAPPPRTTAAAPPADAPPAMPPARTERCRTLFSTPWELAPADHRATDQAMAESLINPDDQSTGTDGSAPALPLVPRLRQTLSLFADDGAAAAYDAIRASVTDCQKFETTLEDGALATVFLRDLEVAGDGADGAYAVQIIALSGDRTYTGYLAIGRVGPMLSVLRTVGPAGTVDTEDAEDTLDLALDKMALLADPTPPDDTD